jgi:DNA-binding CsgD family transcriptional regulator
MVSKAVRHDSFVPSPTLVGRESEQQRLRTCLDTALTGHGGLVLIGGEAGIGKTALAEDLCRTAMARGAFAVTGHCYDLTETPPFGPWIEIITRMNMLPQVSDTPSVPVPELSTAVSQAAMFSQTRAFLAAYASHRPLVLLLEDCHWADAASLDVLRFLAREVATLPVILLVTFRSDELAQRHPLYTLVPILEREARTTRLEVRRLDPVAVRALVAEQYALDPADVERLADWLDVRAGGNAFFTTQLLHALAGEAVLRPAGGRWALGDLTAISVPLRLRQVIDARALRLNEDVRALLAVAAMLGQEVPFALWGAVTERDEEALFTAAEAAIVARLVEATADGTGVQFVHTLVREALVEGMLPFRRRALHRRVGEVLETLPGADPDAVAYHFQRAGDARAVGWLITAGERAEQSYALLIAAERYEAALRLLEAQRGEVGAQGWLLLRLAFMRRFVDPDRTLTQLAAAAKCAAAADDPHLSAWILVCQGNVRLIYGGMRAGLDDLAAGLAAVETLPPGDEANRRFVTAIGTAINRGTLIASLAYTGKLREARLEAQSYIRRGADPATDRADVARAVDAWFGWAFAAALLGCPEEARRAFAAVRAAYETIGQYIPISAALVMELAHVILPYQADDPAGREQVARAAEQVLRQVLAARAVRGHPEFTQYPYLPLMWVDGRWDDVRRLARVDGADDTYTTAMIRYTRNNTLGRVAHAQGARDLAWQTVREIWPDGPVAEPGDRDLRFALAPLQLAIVLALEGGDPATARAWLEMHDRLIEGAGAVLGQSERQILWAAYYRATDDPRRAKEHAMRALAHAAEPRQPLALLTAHRLLGELDTDAGQHVTARDHLATALALAAACHAPYERALSLLALADLDAATANVAQAHVALDEARAICEPLRAQPALARAAALAARLASTSARPALPAGLTEREAEVLGLVAEGLTNAQVADRLYLSPRTVDFHLRSIYGKLGVSSRAAATRYAVEHHLN